MSLRLQPIDLQLLGWDKTDSEQTSDAEGYSGNEEHLLTPLEKLTTASTNGTGAFDVLMKSIKAHLEEEYDSQRITGKDYTTVYLGAMTAAMQTSIQFLLNEQQVNKLNAEIGLVRQQIVTELANTDDNVPVGLGFNYIPGTSDEIDIRYADPCPDKCISVLPLDEFDNIYRFDNVDGLHEDGGLYEDDGYYGE